MSSQGRFRQRLSTLAANWRVLALRGLAALIFGLVILFWPGLIPTGPATLVNTRKRPLDVTALHQPARMGLEMTIRYEHFSL